MDGNIYFYDFSPGCVIFISGTDFLFGNRVLGAGLDTKLTDVMIKELIKFFQKANRPKFNLQICPGVLSEKTKKFISDNNGIHQSNWVKLVKPIDEIVPMKNEIEIRRIYENEIDGVSDILVKSFSFPPEIKTFCKGVLGKNGWTTYVGLLDNKIAGTGAIYINGDIAELGIAATDESSRCKGIQSALISARESFAVEKYCKYIFVETAEPTPQFSAPSYRNMIRFGYSELYRRGNYVFKLV